MGRAKGSIDTTPHPVRASRDSDAYLGSDSGCGEATKYLGEQSICLECPFDVCHLDTSHRGRKAKLVDK